MTPIKAELDAIENMNTKAEMAMRFGLAMRNNLDTPVAGYVDIDAKKPTRYIFRFYQTGLSFADYDYYLKDTAEFKKLRGELRAHVERMLKLAGVKNAGEQAGWVLAIETEIAKAHWSLERARDDELTYNLWPKAKFDGLGVGYNWNLILEAAGVEKQTEFLVGQPDTLIAVSKLIDSVPLHQWKAWRYPVGGVRAVLAEGVRCGAFCVLRHDRAWAAEAAGALAARDGHAVQLPRRTVGSALCREVFPRVREGGRQGDDQALRHVAQQSDRQGVLDERFDEEGGAREATRSEQRSVIRTGGKDYASLKIDRGDLVGNVVRSTAWQWTDMLNKLGKPIDTHEWLMVPQENNAYYWPQRNEIVFPAGILQAPYYVDPAADLASNYGEIGATIGHG